jgi:hypothetical protein
MPRKKENHTTRTIVKVHNNTPFVKMTTSMHCWNWWCMEDDNVWASIGDETSLLPLMVITCQKWRCTKCVEMSIQYPLFNFHGLSKQNEMNSSSWWKYYNKLFSNIVEQKTNLHWHEPKHRQWAMMNIKFEFEDSNAWLSKICMRLWQLLKSSKALSPKPKPNLPSTTHSSSIITQGYGVETICHMNLQEYPM